MSVFTFDVTSFRLMFPVFEDQNRYPDVRLQMYWTMGTSYIDDNNVNWGAMKGADRLLALNLMTAHLTWLSVLVQEGQTPYVIQGSAIDKINITLTPPPIPNQYRWWLQTTSYGIDLLALLQAKSVGGFLIAGLPETAAFRRVGGVFI